MVYSKFKSGDISFGGQAMKMEIEQKEEKVRSLVKQLAVVDEKLAERNLMMDKSEELTLLQTEIRELLEANTVRQSKLESIDEALAETVDMFDDYKQRYRKQVREKAVGTKLEKLTLMDGKTYHRVEVKSVGAVGLNITHRDGSARIPFKQLPMQMQKEFQFDEEEADAQQRKEAELRRIRQRALSAAQAHAEANPTVGEDPPDAPKMSEAERDRAIGKLESAIRSLESRIQIVQGNIIEEKKKTVSRAPIYRAELEELNKALRANQTRLRELRSMR